MERRTQVSENGRANLHVNNQEPTDYVTQPRHLRLRVLIVRLLGQAGLGLFLARGSTAHGSENAHMYKFWFACSASLTLLILSALGAAVHNSTPSRTKAQTEGCGPAVLWRDPGNITQRDLYYGPGGKQNQPKGTFKFEKEDLNGSNPKFLVVDQDGVKWTVKIGDEARPETVASRLVWAVGYFANQDYFLPVLHVEGMRRLHRGGDLVSPDGTTHAVRLKRHLKDEKKIGTWSWANNPFTATREWYGLRVLMAVINNWDLKDSNNAIYQTGGEDPQQLYIVSDLGSSFGSSGLNWARKGDLKAYVNSNMIGKTSRQFTDFHVPAPPRFYIFVDPPELTRRLGLCWLGRHIPTDDAKWMGHLLAQLSLNQIRDAFRAAGYTPADVESFSSAVERRIGELQKL